MIEKTVLLFDQIDKKILEIKFEDILKICLLTKDLPKSKGDIYFLISSLEALKILEKTKYKTYKIDWTQFNQVKKDGGFE